MTSVPPRNTSPGAIQTMFNAIAPTYDFLNHLLSFGQDIRWRRKAVRCLAEKKGGKVLDIASGSGDFSLEVSERLEPSHVVASDFALEMLSTFRRKTSKSPPRTPIDLAASDAHWLPFRDESFDATIVAFGIRNFADRPRALGEMLRVLRPGGVTVILELTVPRGKLPRTMYRAYARMLLPALGRIISRHQGAYRYLPDSIAEFPEQDDFLMMMGNAGFAAAHARPLTFGAATIYTGRKPES